MVEVFPDILPASIEVAPYSPIALAKLSIAPENSEGDATGHTILKKILNSDSPKVLPAYIKFLSSCKNADFAFLYISGNAIIKAAITHPTKLWTIFIWKCPYKNIPTGLLLLNIRSRKNPTTVGGSTIGSVSILSNTAIIFLFIYKLTYASPTPRKKHIIVEKSPIFRVIKKGLQSKCAKTLFI